MKRVKSGLPRTLGILLAISILLVLYDTAAIAAAYPSRPLRLVIPYAAGASIDIVGRKIAMSLSKRLGKPVVVEHRPGGGGIVGTERVARAVPDGYTLMMQNPSLLTTYLLEKVPYDIRSSFIPIAKLGSGVNVLVAHPSVQANSLKELIALAKQNPGKLLFATTAVGASAHLGIELFKIMAGIDIKIVHFGGSGAALIDVLGGHSNATSTSLTNVVPHLKTGRLKVLATGGKKRTVFLPDVLTIAESGVPGYEHVNWWGILAPAGTPAPIVERLNRELKTILGEAETRKWFETQGAEAEFQGTPEFRADLERELTKWGEVVKKANIRQNK